MHETTPADLKCSIQRPAEEEGPPEAEAPREAPRTPESHRPRLRPRVPLVETGLGDPSVARRTDEYLDGFGR